MHAHMKDDFKMIYTSYFGKFSALREMSGIACVSIAGKTPEWFSGAKYKQLAPKYDWWQEWHLMFAGKLNSPESIEWYTNKYYATVLRDFDPLKTAQDIKDLSRWNVPVLMCYEKPGDFCHRSIVRKWLNDHRIECKEIEV